MNPSQDQMKSAVRTLIATVGGALAGWAIGKGWITQAEASAILSNQELMGAASVIILTLLGSAGSMLAGIWGIWSKTQANLVAAVAAMPEVSKVETMPTPAGVSLANDANGAAAGIPAAVIAVAGAK